MLGLNNNRWGDVRLGGCVSGGKVRWNKGQ